jgi:hypothetical protein
VRMLQEGKLDLAVCFGEPQGPGVNTPQGGLNRPGFSRHL